MAFYNLKLEKEVTLLDCIACPLYDSRLKVCNGHGKICFGIDPTTKTLIEPTTGLPIKIKENENGNTQ